MRLGELGSEPFLVALDQHGELVAAEPAHRVLRPQTGAEPVGHRHQHLVAGRVPEAVVDRLEVVHVHEEHGDAFGAAAALQAVLDAVGEQSAVGEAGQRIMECLVGELPLECLLVGDVAVVDDDSADHRIVQHVLAGRLERPPRAVGMARPQLDGAQRIGRAGQVAKDAGYQRDIIGVHPIGDTLTWAIDGLVAEDALDGRGLVEHLAIDTDHHHDVRGVLDQAPESLLAPLELHHQPALAIGGFGRHADHLVALAEQERLADDALDEDQRHHQVDGQAQHRVVLGERQLVDDQDHRGSTDRDQRQCRSDAAGQLADTGSRIGFEPPGRAAVGGGQHADHGDHVHRVPLRRLQPAPDEEPAGNEDQPAEHEH